MGLQNANENEFHDFGSLVIWLCKTFGKVMEIRGEIFKNLQSGPPFSSVPKSTRIRRYIHYLRSSFNDVVAFGFIVYEESYAGTDISQLVIGIILD